MLQGAICEGLRAEMAKEGGREETEICYAVLGQATRRCPSYEPLPGSGSDMVAMGLPSPSVRVQPRLEDQLIAAATEDQETGSPTAPDEVLMMTTRDEEDGIGVDQLAEIALTDEIRSLHIDADEKYKAEGDVKGGELNPYLVMKARDEEVGYIVKRDVYNPSIMATYWNTTGRA